MPLCCIQTPGVRKTVSSRIEAASLEDRHCYHELLGRAYATVIPGLVLWYHPHHPSAFYIYHAITTNKHFI